MTLGLMSENKLFHSLTSRLMLRIYFSPTLVPARVGRHRNPLPETAINYVNIGQREKKKQLYLWEDRLQNASGLENDPREDQIFFVWRDAVNPLTETPKSPSLKSCTCENTSVGVVKDLPLSRSLASRRRRVKPADSCRRLL